MLNKMKLSDELHNLFKIVKEIIENDKIDLHSEFIY